MAWVADFIHTDKEAINLASISVQSRKTPEKRDTRSCLIEEHMGSRRVITNDIVTQDPKPTWLVTAVFSHHNVLVGIFRSPNLKSSTLPLPGCWQGVYINVFLLR